MNHDSKPYQPGKPRSQVSLRPKAAIVIDGRHYEVIKQLSVPERGRWLVRDPQPRPRGTLRLAIESDDSPSARQLERSLFKLPRDANSIPHLVATGYQQGKKIWIVSWIEGMVLETYLQRVCDGRFRRLNLWEPVRRVKSLAHGLRMLDKFCGIVHGDIKPANLILPSQCGTMGLIDFGSSWQVSRTARRVAGDGIEAAYSAPEMLLGLDQVDSRADQFSIAVVLYEMLTMQLPYAGLGGKAGLPKYRQEAEVAFEPPSQLVQPQRLPSSILQELDCVLHTSLSLDADDRFANPQDFCLALDRLWLKLQEAQDSVAKCGVQTSESDRRSTVGQIATKFLAKLLRTKV